MNVTGHPLLFPLKKLLLVCLLIGYACSVDAAPTREYYLIQVYHCSHQKQLDGVDDYLKNTYLPFLHARGIGKVGVFSPLRNDTAADKQIFVWIPLTKLSKLEQLEADIERLDPFGSDALGHLDNPDSSLPYTRIETMLAKSFKNFPVAQAPKTLAKTDERIFEFRSYESATENLYLRKQHMFNEGNEIDIFNRLNFNPIFFAKVLAGGRMPNLVYMTSFNNMADRDAHWKAFGADAYWKTISAMPAYAKTVSKADIILMHAKSYADF